MRDGVALACGISPNLVTGLAGVLLGLRDTLVRQNVRWPVIFCGSSLRVCENLRYNLVYVCTMGKAFFSTDLPPALDGMHRRYQSKTYFRACCGSATITISSTLIRFEMVAVLRPARG